MSICFSSSEQALDFGCSQSTNMAVPLPHKSFRVFSLLCLLACHFLPTLCQTSTNNSDTGPGPQAVTFTVPDSGSDDFTQRFVDGQTVPASWTGDTTWTGSLGDLWLTWFYSNAYTLLLLGKMCSRSYTTTLAELNMYQKMSICAYQVTILG